MWNPCMKDPLRVNPSKGNQGTTRGKEKILFDLGGYRTQDLRIRSEGGGGGGGVVIMPTSTSTQIPNHLKRQKTLHQQWTTQ